MVNKLSKCDTKEKFKFYIDSTPVYVTENGGRRFKFGDDCVSEKALIKQFEKVIKADKHLTDEAKLTNSDVQELVQRIKKLSESATQALKATESQYKGLKLKIFIIKTFFKQFLGNIGYNKEAHLKEIENKQYINLISLQQDESLDEAETSAESTTHSQTSDSSLASESLEPDDEDFLNLIHNLKEPNEKVLDKLANKLLQCSTETLKFIFENHRKIYDLFLDYALEKNFALHHKLLLSFDVLEHLHKDIDSTIELAADEDSIQETDASNALVEPDSQTTVLQDEILQQIILGLETIDDTKLIDLITTQFNQAFIELVSEALNSLTRDFEIRNLFFEFDKGECSHATLTIIQSHVYTLLRKLMSRNPTTFKDEYDLYNQCLHAITKKICWGEFKSHRTLYEKNPVLYKFILLNVYANNLEKMPSDPAFTNMLDVMDPDAFKAAFLKTIKY